MSTEATTHTRAEEKSTRRFGTARAGLAVVSVLLGMTTLCGAELVENGDFGEDIPYWSLRMHHSLTPAPEARVGENTFSAKKIPGVSTHYYILSQAVEIKKGVRYKLSYEVKGPAEGEYRHHAVI